MSWFSKYVGDPLKALLVQAEKAAEAELKVLAGDVAATIPATPISAAAEVGFETGLQSAFDAVLTTVVPDVPVVGAAVEPSLKAAGNAAIDYIVTKGTDSLNALAAQAKARLEGLADATAAAPVGAAATAAATASVAIGAAATAAGDPLNPTAADIAAQAAT